MDTRAVESDLQYVKGLVEKAGQSGLPVSICLLWALIVPIGFGLADFAPHATGWFWMIAGPLGGILSGFLGRRAGLRIGQMDREEGVRHVLHWGGMLAVILLSIALAVLGHVEGPVLGGIILLIVAMGWWTAGVHFDRSFLLPGGIMMAGFLAVMARVRYAWTGTGVLIAVTLLYTALRKGARDAARKA
ncbi:MAG TPA: hypothetical protein PK274_08810 [Candidatus Fermentibacter daniensis]|nr:hypothetical protein [Candidatus Fermentibacter daniensis]